MDGMRAHTRLELFQRTRQIRLERNLTFAALATEVGCSLATVRRFASGLGRPNERTLFLFQTWLGKQRRGRNT